MYGKILDCVDNGFIIMLYISLRFLFQSFSLVLFSVQAGGTGHLLGNYQVKKKKHQGEEEPRNRRQSLSLSFSCSVLCQLHTNGPSDCQPCLRANN